MNVKTFGIIIVVVAILGGWYFLSDTSEEGVVVGDVTPDVTVTYTDTGYSPKEITIPVGTTVIFVNQSSKKMWVASAMHPTHIVYSGTSLAKHCPDTTNSAFDECMGGAPGESFSFTFNKVGVWKYHDHIDASKAGVVTVTASAQEAN